MMTVVNGECKSTKIYTGNLLSKGSQHAVCQKLAYKIKQKFYIEGWQIEKMLTGTHNLIPIIYFHFTSLNPSATFQNNGKINSIILESIIYPQSFFSSLPQSSLHFLSLETQGPLPLTPQRHLFSISSPAHANGQATSLAVLLIRLICHCLMVMTPEKNSWAKHTAGLFEFLFNAHFTPIWKGEVKLKASVHGVKKTPPSQQY